MQQSTILICAAIAVLAGCGASGGSGGSTSTNTPTPYASTYMVLSLDGRALSTSAAPGVSDTSIAFVRTRNDIYAGMYLVTQRQWRTIMGTTPWSEVTPAIAAPTSDEHAPAYNISHDEAVDFADKISHISGLRIQLQTSAQWARWCGNEYPWGTATDPATVGLYATVQETRAVDGPVATGSKRPNALGMYDLVGNIRTWTAEGSLVGGSWNDGIISSGTSHALESVDVGVRHPLSGLRIIAVP